MKNVRSKSLYAKPSEQQAKPVQPDDFASKNAFPVVENAHLHDLYAASPADAVSTGAFALALAVEAAAGRPVVWALHEMMALEAGRPHGPGLHELGLRPNDLLLVRAREIKTLLTVGEDALRSCAVGAVVLSAWGDSRTLTLTASRRLSMAARTGGASMFLVRAGVDPMPSAAETRWSVRAVASTPLEGDAPGHPVFSATLLRSRGGWGGPRTWIMEWDRERRSFIAQNARSTPVSGDMVSLAAQRSAGAPDGGLRRAG